MKLSSSFGYTVTALTSKFDFLDSPSLLILLIYTHMKLVAFTTISLLACSQLFAQSTAEQSTVAPAIPAQSDAKKFIEAYPHKPGYVISPFKPYNVLDVKHLKTGNLAYDPFTAPKDPTTGKIDIRKAKIFRVPAPKPKPAEADTATSS